MSAFYGMVQGNRGEATRGGSKASGFTASCQSWDGSVITSMRYNKNDELMVRLSLAEGSCSGGWCAEDVFYGTFEELRKVFEDYRAKKAAEDNE